MGPVSVFAWPWSQSDFKGGSFSGPVGPTYRSMFGGFHGFFMGGIINGPRIILPPGPVARPHSLVSKIGFRSKGYLLEPKTALQTNKRRPPITGNARL
jgi:hypothetical protein